jgi:DNA-binding Lrp family transcriptional regulator
MTRLEPVDRALLEQIQAEFPLVPQPFAAQGEALGLDENDVLARVRRLKGEGIIRQIGAIFDTQRLGYRSTLVAFHVGDGRVEDVASRISAHPGVSHNYVRPHHYNLWFTLAVPPGQKTEDELSRLAQQTRVDDWLNLPALRVFKIRTHFSLDEDGVQTTDTRPQVKAPSRDLAPTDIPFIRALQQDLPLVPRPFAKIAERLGLSEEELLDKARELAGTGIMRRFSAVLRHRRIGYTANGMVCWVVPESQIAEVGRVAAGYSQVSHCYQRPAYPPDWPYTLFTMVHGQTRAEVESVVAEIARETGLDRYTVLYSTREYKKERVRYFEEET